MFVIHLEYIASLAEIDHYLVAHREYLASCYQQNLILASGPQDPRTGGIIIGLGNDKAVIEAMIQADPFFKQHLAHYTITAFSPVKYRQEIAHLI